MDVLCNDHMQQNSRFILTCHESLNRKMKNKNLKQRLSKNILYNKGLQRVPMWMKKSFEACYYSRLGFTRQTKEAMLYENKMNSFFILFTFWMSHRAFFLFNLKSSSSAPLISRYILWLGQVAQQQLHPRGRVALTARCIFRLEEQTIATGVVLRCVFCKIYILAIKASSIETAAPAKP